MEWVRWIRHTYNDEIGIRNFLCDDESRKILLENLYIVDRFGDAVETSPTDHEHFAAVAEVSVSQTFFAWVFQFNGDIQIKGPESVVDRYKAMLTSALDK